jgi:hypothetical protein
MNFDLRHLGAQ